MIDSESLYSLSPRAFSRVNDLRQHLAHFGTQCGRYIWAMPGKKVWQRSCRDFFQSAGDLEKTRLIELLRQVGDSGAMQSDPVGCNGKLNAFSDKWVEDATRTWREYKLRPRRIWVSSAEFEAFAVDDRDQFLVNVDDGEVLDSYLQQEVDADASEYWRLSRILCRMSRGSEAHFVDPYALSSWKRWERFFDGYIRKFAEESEGPSSAHFWVKNSLPKDYAGLIELSDLQSRLDKQFHSIDRCGRGVVKFEFHFLDDKTMPDSMHARYILTDRGGITFDRGFACDGKRNLVSAMSRKLCMQEFERFSCRRRDRRVEEVERFSFEVASKIRRSQ